MSKYKLVSSVFSRKHHNALELQHHAAQFIALVGRHLIKQDDDDSNTNMQYLIKEDLLVGNYLHNNIRVALKLSDLSLCLLNTDSSCINSIRLGNKSTDQIFEDLKQMLTLAGISTKTLSKEIHYDMPYHNVMDGEPYIIDDTKSLEFNSILRSNAHISLEKILTEYSIKPDIRIWPHHFDTGSTLPLDQNKLNTTSSSIGLGWAIPDNMINEPYYYLSYWREDGDIDLSRTSPPSGSAWSVTSWHGAALKHSDLIVMDTPEDQLTMITEFFKSGIEFLNKYNNEK